MKSISGPSGLNKIIIGIRNTTLHLYFLRHYSHNLKIKYFLKLIRILENRRNFKLRHAFSNVSKSGRLVRDITILSIYDHDTYISR